MLELRVLGGPDIRDADGVELRGVLAQPKRVALLAYLAARPLPDFHRRDTLLALFWPEKDTRQARAALRSSLHFLRQTLGAEVLISRGLEEVGLDGERLWCDVAGFRFLAAAGKPDEALALYRGDLLAGFHLSGAPGWEEWLERERVSLREQAREAAWAMAEREEAAGHTALAAHFARRAAELNPDDEPTLRRRMELLVRIGDRAGALRAYREFAARLEREYEVEPDPETRRLAERIASDDGDASPGHGGAEPPTAARPVAAHTPGEAVDAVEDGDAVTAPRAIADRSTGPPAEALDPPTATPVDADVERRSAGPVNASWRRHGGGARGARAWRLAPALVVVLALLAAAATLRLRSGAEPPEPTTLAVFPFSFHGGPTWEYLGDGMVKLMTTALDGTGGLRTVDPRALHSQVRRDGREIWDPERGPAIAAALGAGAYVLGHIVEAEGRLRITATLYDAQRGSGARVSEATVEGDGSSIFAMVDELSTRLLARAASPRHLGGVAARTTVSPEALLAFLEGEQELRVGRPAEAAAAFRRAVRADSTFALAYYGLSRAAHWLVHTGGRDDGADRALHFSTRLGPQDRALIHAWEAYRHGDAARADSIYRAVLRERPDDVEAWLQLGEVRFHFGSVLGRPAEDAREAFEQVLRFEPDNVGAMAHLARLAAHAGELARLDSLVQRILALDPDPHQVFQLLALRSLAHEEPRLPESVRTRLDYASLQALRFTTTLVAAHSRNLAGSREFAEEVTARMRTPADSAWGLLMLSQLELARGRWSEASRTLSRVGRVAPDLEAEYRAAFLVFPLLDPSAAELAAARDALARLHDQAGPAARPGLRQRHRYLLAQLSERLGDGEAALAHRTVLERWADATTVLDSAFARRLALDLRAAEAARAGRAAEALELLGPPAPQPDLASRPELSSYYKAYERWLRAELLAALGRDEEAIGVYASFPDPEAYDLVYKAPSHLRRAELLADRGDTARAAEHLARFIDLWSDADPEFQPLVSGARRSLAALAQPPGPSSPASR